jgi:hypothetical protein
MDSATLIIVILSLVIYFLPALIAADKRNSGVILLLNIFLGWTGLAWLLLIVWACTSQTTADYELTQEAMRKLANQ